MVHHDDDEWPRISTTITPPTALASCTAESNPPKRCPSPCRKCCLRTKPQMIMIGRPNRYYRSITNRTMPNLRPKNAATPSPQEGPPRPRKSAPHYSMPFLRWAWSSLTKLCYPPTLFHRYKHWHFFNLHRPHWHWRWQVHWDILNYYRLASGVWNR